MLKYRSSNLIKTTAKVLETPMRPDSKFCRGELTMFDLTPCQSKTKKRAPARSKELFVCAECGKQFLRYRSTMHNPERPFCSRACVGKSKRNGCELHCALCDTSFYRMYGEQDLAVRVNQFCSVKCYQEWRSINLKIDTYIKRNGRHVHRTIAESILQRPLTQDEVVHHIDGDKHNNHPSNLAVLPSQSFHAKVHFGEVSDAELRQFSLQ